MKQLPQVSLTNDCDPLPLFSVHSQMSPSSFPGLTSCPSRADCEPAAPNFPCAEQEELGLLWHRGSISSYTTQSNHFFYSLIIKDNLKLKSCLKPDWNKVSLINCSHVQKTWGYFIGIFWSGHSWFCLSQDFVFYPFWGYRKCLFLNCYGFYSH